MSRRLRDGVAGGVPFERLTRGDAWTGFWKASLLKTKPQLWQRSPGGRLPPGRRISLPQRLQ
jgi:hypothetical protein